VIRGTRKHLTPFAAFANIDRFQHLWCAVWTNFDCDVNLWLYNNLYNRTCSSDIIDSVVN